MNRPKPSFVYPDKIKAALGALVESCLALTGLEFVVGGGWVPYLRGKENALVHPGTVDVDLVFRNDYRNLNNAAMLLASKGFLSAAKTRYVRYKALRVGKEVLIFNVDLLLLFPNEINVVLDHKLWSPFEVEAIVPSGDTRRTSIPLMDEAGLVMLKSSAIWQITQINKRTRDAFDIYFMLSGPSGPQIAARYKALGAKSDIAGRNFSLLERFVKDKADSFNRQVHEYCEGEKPPNPAGKVAALLAGA